MENRFQGLFFKVEFLTGISSVLELKIFKMANILICTGEKLDALKQEDGLINKN